jgi:lysophospholipase L1-like esterase
VLPAQYGGKRARTRNRLHAIDTHDNVAIRPSGLTPISKYGTMLLMFRQMTVWSQVLFVGTASTAVVACASGSGTPGETTTTATSTSAAPSVTPTGSPVAPVTPVTPGVNPTTTNTTTAPPSVTPSVPPTSPSVTPTQPNTSTSPTDASEGSTGSSGSEPDVGTTSDTSNSTEVPSGDPEVRFIGRVARNGETATFAWSGTGIVAAFEGTSVSVQLNDSGSNQFTVLVDEMPQPLLDAQSGSHAYPLATGLIAGRHTVEIYRRTEANQGETTFEGFDFGDGALAAPPPPKPRRIEIVGDSITCGYGNEGADTSCGFTPETENHYLTYGAVAARALNAELSTVAWSGKGVVYNYDTDTNNPMPTLYKRVLPDDASSVWDFSVKPDAVVINLGTNDFSTDGDPTTEQFRDAYMGLVGQIREGAPDAFILCTNGNMLSGADLDAARAGIHAAVDALTTAGDTQIAAWDMNVPNDEPGCDWHPTKATHALMADALVTELKTHLTW